MSKLQKPISIMITALLISAVSVLATAKSVDFNFTKDQQRTTIDIIDKLSSQHYHDQNFDDDLSSRMLDEYIVSLDSTKAFFLQADIEEFERYRTTLDDTMKRGDLSPGLVIFDRYFERAQQRLSWVIAQLENPNLTFNYALNESLLVSTDKTQWAKTEAEANDLWRKRLKANVLSLKLAGESDEKAHSVLLKRYISQLSRLQQQDEDDVFEGLINSLALLYDPHTSYLSPRTMENFNISMSLSLEGIGAVLQAEDEFTKVVRVIHAGPAAQQGQLQSSDRIVAVGQGRSGEMIDVVGWRLDDVVKLIRGPKKTVVRLSVIPANAADDSIRKLISINRGKVKLEEQAAKKGIIELNDGDNLYRVGVINVPTFYLDFEAYRQRNPNYKSTTRDVYRLLEELQYENVDGLILDLRNNGGGSLQEATTLTDLFVDQGPVVQIRQATQRISRNFRSRQKAVYRGPLVVLTNRLSASASEIFAGAIQDYKRGLVVGSQSFGKGTVQSLTPVHTGELKITESKFYRISGGSTQHKGVIPDVAFPFLVDAEEVGESSYKTALTWDQIHAVPHDTYFDFDSILDEVRNNHEQRKSVNPDFIYLAKQLESLKASRDKESVSLNETQRMMEKQTLELAALTLENQRRMAKGMTAFKDVKSWKQDTEDKTAAAIKNANKNKELDTNDDALLAESGYILIDLIKLLDRNSKAQAANF